MIFTGGISNIYYKGQYCFHDYNRPECYDFLILDGGDTIPEYLRDVKLSLEVTVLFGIQTLQTLSDIHGRGVVQDCGLKRGNFVVDAAREKVKLVGWNRWETY